MKGSCTSPSVTLSRSIGAAVDFADAITRVVSIARGVYYTSTPQTVEGGGRRRPPPMTLAMFFYSLLI